MIVIDIVSLALRACYTYALPFSTHLDASFLLFLASPHWSIDAHTNLPLATRCIYESPRLTESMASVYVNATLPSSALGASGGWAHLGPKMRIRSLSG